MRGLHCLLPGLMGMILLLTGGCRGNWDQPDDRKIFRYNEAADISSLDPAFARDQANIWAVNQIFNGLVQLNDRLEVVPCIASRWEVSPDGTRYTFHLRRDVCFHDDACFPESQGRRLIAADFVYSFNRIMHPSTASPGSWVFGWVADTVPFTAPDDSTLVISLKKPFPPFIGILTTQYCSAVPREAVEKYGSEFRSHPVGTGPFYFAMWKEGVKLVMRRNENYFEKVDGKQLPFLEAVSVT